MNIEGKVAVITGGASGLGRATAEMIIANGGQVAILDLNEDLAKTTANELGDARAYQVNVTDDESVSAAEAGGRGGGHSRSDTAAEFSCLDFLTVVIGDVAST